MRNNYKTGFNFRPQHTNFKCSLTIDKSKKNNLLLLLYIYEVLTLECVQNRGCNKSFVKLFILFVKVLFKFEFVFNKKTKFVISMTSSGMMYRGRDCGGY